MKRINRIPITLMILGALHGCSEQRMGFVEFESINSELSILIPHLGPEHDIDDATPGVQVRIRVRSSAMAGDEIWLEAGGTRYVVRAAYDGGAVFESVTLARGGNRLLAGCASCRQREIQLELKVPELSLKTPNGWPVSCAEDLDPDRPELQTELVFAAMDVFPGTAVTVLMDGETYEGTIIDGQAIVLVTLPAETALVPVQASLVADGRAVTTAGSVTVHCPRCAISRIGEDVVDGQVGASVLLGLLHDQAPDAPGAQVDLEVDADGIADTRVLLILNGVPIGIALPTEQRVAVFGGISLRDGDRLQARCENARAATVEGPELRVLLDTEPPEPVSDLKCDWQAAYMICSWTAPADPGGLAHVASWELRYVVAGELDAESYDEAIAVEALPLPSAAGVEVSFQFPLDALTTLPVSFAMISQDEAGNTSELSNIATAPAVP